MLFTKIYSWTSFVLLLLDDPRRVFQRFTSFLATDQIEADKLKKEYGDVIDEIVKLTEILHLPLRGKDVA